VYFLEEMQLVPASCLVCEARLTAHLHVLSCMPVCIPCCYSDSRFRLVPQKFLFDHSLSKLEAKSISSVLLWDPNHLGTKAQIRAFLYEDFFRLFISKFPTSAERLQVTEKLGNRSYSLIPPEYALLCLEAPHLPLHFGAFALAPPEGLNETAHRLMGCSSREFLVHHTAPVIESLKRGRSMCPVCEGPSEGCPCARRAAAEEDECCD
jgi:hypothetical protein